MCVGQLDYTIIKWARAKLHFEESTFSAMNPTRATLQNALSEGDYPRNRFSASRQLSLPKVSQLVVSTIRARLPEIVGLGIFVTVGILAVWLVVDRVLVFGVMAIGGLLTIYLVGQPRNPSVQKNPSSSLTVEPTWAALGSLAHIAELKDEELAGHSERVAENSVCIGRELGLGESLLDELWWAGLLHDLGKIGVSQSILRKPGPLTSIEMREVKEHPEYGAKIVDVFLEGDAAISEAIRHHHERWDGSGYPYGLIGEAIPPLARIVAVADVFEALTSQRAYREALTPAQAALYISREAGSHFDPAVVEAFDTCFRSGLLSVATISAGYCKRAESSISISRSSRLGRVGRQFCDTVGKRLCGQRRWRCSA